MEKKSTDAKTSKRTGVKDLSKSAKDLSTAEAKKVRGGKVTMQDFHFTKTINKSSP